MGWQVRYYQERDPDLRKYILKNKPDAKIAVL